MPSMVEFLRLYALVACAAAVIGCDDGSFDDINGTPETDEEVEERVGCIYGPNPPAVDVGAARFLSSGGCDLAVREEIEPSGVDWQWLNVVVARPGSQNGDWEDPDFNAIVWSRQCVSSGWCGGWTRSSVPVDDEVGSMIGGTGLAVHTLRGSVAVPPSHNVFRVGTRAKDGVSFTVPVYYYFTES